MITYSFFIFCANFQTKKRLIVTCVFECLKLCCHILKKLREFLCTMCRNPSIWLATKARGLRGCGLKSRPESHITCSRECKECEGVNPHTPKWTPTLGVGESWSPKGTPELQREIWGVKSQWLVALFISMKSSWSVDVQNGLALLIWTSETQVVAKRRPGSPPVLTPDE
jgi:hypothetical protein